jgi:glycosyltransferase involved in cell wall biosynthesis
LKLNYKPLESVNHLFLNSAIRSSIEKADTIYVHSPLPMAILAKKMHPEAKVIVHLHNFQPVSYTSVVFHDENVGGDFARSIRLELLENRSLSRALLSGTLSWINIVNRIALSYADKIICVSNKQAEILKKRVEGVSEKIEVIYNPIPSSEKTEKAPAERPTMLYLGGESHIKGFHVMLAALWRLHLESDEIICAGNFKNSYPDSLPAKIVGRIDHATVHKLYTKTWAVLAPSIVEEPMPYAIVEAMATGTIPVASRVGGVPELVQGTYAEKTLFTPGDVDEFVDKIRGVLSLSREEIVEIGMQLKNATAREFDEETIRRHLLRVFDCSKSVE